MQKPAFPQHLTESAKRKADSGAAHGSAKLDPETLAALKPILDDGDDARSNRGQFQKLIVEIAMALGVPCDNCKSEIIHAQYMEIGERIKQRISPNAESSHAGAETPK